MDELSEDDRLSVSRARKIEKFMGQPFHVAEQFAGMAGIYVEKNDTIRSFEEILQGKHDDIPEQAIEDALKKAAELAKKGRLRWPSPSVSAARAPRSTSTW